MNRAQLFWNLMAKRYARSPIGNMKGYEHTLSLVKKYLKKNHSVLEFGCGTASTAVKLASRVKSYLATDISKNMVSIGKKQAFNKKLKNLKCVQASLFDKRLKTYDVILGFNILHLVDHPLKHLKRAHTLLKPGGLLITKTPCLKESTALSVLSWGIRLLIGPMSCVTKKEFETMHTKAGFKILKKHVYRENPDRIVIIATRK